MAQVKLFRKDDLTGVTVDRKRADLLIQTAGYTESYEEALAASTTLGGSNYTGTAGTPKQSDSTQLTESAKNRIAEIGKSKISNEDKIRLQQLVYDQQNKEIEAITSRWQADANSDSWLSKNVRPLVLVWCIVIFSFAGILDSVESVPFHIGELWNDTFEKVMMAVVLAYFGGRTTEKATSMFKK